MQSLYIQEQAQLIALCQQLATSTLLTLDTEFVRTRTYYPKLGLLQVCNGEVLALIDPVSVSDLTPFWALLSNPNIRKVLHACSEDLEVFFHAGCKPENLIDSQIMMAFLGHGLSMGYAAMIEHFTTIALDKSESRTNWLKRPLTPRQLEYAQDDVKYLMQVYPTIVTQLTQKQLLKYAEEESQKLVDKKFTPTNEERLYLEIKQAWRLNNQQLNRLKYLAKWRYNKAQERDIPLNFVVKEATLITVAQYNPKNVGVMAAIKDIDVLDVRHQGKAMLAALRQAEKVVPQDYPELITRLDQQSGYKGLYKKVKNFITEQATQLNLPVEVLASKKQINKFLSWHFNINAAKQHENAVDFLQGWRFQLFGKQLCDLIHTER